MSKERYYFDFDNDYALSHRAKTVLQYNEYVVKIYQKCTHLLDAYSSNHLLDLVELNSQSVATNCTLDSNNSPKQSKVSESSERTKQSTTVIVKNSTDFSTRQLIPLPIDYTGNEELQDVFVIPDKQFSPVRVEIEPDVRTNQNLSLISSKKELPSRTEERTPMQVKQNTTVAGKFQRKLSQLGHKEMDKTAPVNLDFHCPTRNQTDIVTPEMTNKADSNCKREVYRKYLNPDTLLFRSMPRIIKSSRGIEIEIYISSLRPENPISTTTPVSPLRSKITKPVADESIDEDRSAKNANLSVNEPKPWDSRGISSSANLSVNEPKPGCSKDISSSAKSSISRSQPVAENSESSIRADMDRGKDRLSYKSPERSSEARISASFSSPSVNILIDCIIQLSNRITMRDGCMQSNYNSLIGFQKCLGYIIIQIENILNVITHIQMVYKYCVNEDFIKNINGLITMSTILINNIVLMRLDVKKDIKLWDKYIEEIHIIKKRMGPLILNRKPSVDFEVLHKYEDSLKAKWERIDNTIPILESRMQSFLRTADDFEKCINLFVKCLINVGVLRLSSSSVL